MNTLYDSDSFAVVHLLPDVLADSPAQEGQPVLALMPLWPALRT